MTTFQHGQHLYHCQYLFLTCSQLLASRLGPSCMQVQSQHLQSWENNLAEAQCKLAEEQQRLEHEVHRISEAQRDAALRVEQLAVSVCPACHPSSCQSSSIIHATQLAAETTLRLLCSHP